MQKFLVLYMAPPAVLEEWAKTDPEKRKEAEGKMQADWKKWMTDHKDALGETAGAGKTKMVTKDGVTDTKNDVMLFSMLEAESPEAAAAIFTDHPHLGIPQASIQIMPVNYLPGMK